MFFINKTPCIHVASDDDPMAPFASDVSILAHGAANVGAVGLDDATDVVEASVRHFVHDYEELRHAAVAERYAATEMSTGLAASLAGVEKGSEIETLLREHGVEPRVGPSADPERRKQEWETAKRVLQPPDDEEEADADEE